MTQSVIVPELVFEKLMTSRLEVPVPPTKVMFEKLTTALPETAMNFWTPAPALVSAMVTVPVLPLRVKVRFLLIATEAVWL